MKIIIDIDEDLYNYIQTEGYDEHLDKRFDYQIRFAVKKGTPLPKGHGRLIDVKQIVYEKECIWETDGCCITRSTPNIAATPTIIEADKEVSNADSD